MLDLASKDQRYFWSVCIDDLEIFLFAMRKRQLTINDFHHILKFCESLHAKLTVNDEGGVLGQFLIHKRFPLHNGLYKFSTTDDIIIDKLYSSGLGFKNERGMDRKTNPNVLKIYSNLNGS